MNTWKDGEPKIARQMTLADFDRMFPDETACKLYLTMKRWPEGPCCPRCGNTKVYEGSGKRAFTWQCMKCGPAKRTPYRFSVTVGTVFENTNYKLLIWFKVLYLILTSKKGISALQIHRMIGSGSYRTAWFMCHRLRAGLADDGFRKLMGIVEVDETYIGGLNKNRHWDKRKHAGGGTVGKTAVVGAIARKGNLVCRVLDDTTAPTLTKFVRQVVNDKVHLVATDQAGGYKNLNRAGFKHETVDHKSGEYVRGVVHTQNLDSFWSLLKRGVMGTYHNVSAKYLPLYLNEFQFRHNNRKNADIFGAAIAGC